MERNLEWMTPGKVLPISRDVFELQLVRPLREEGYRCPRKVVGDIIGSIHQEDQWLILEVKTDPGEDVLVRVGLSPDGTKFTPAGSQTVCSWGQVNVVLDFFQRNL